MHHDLQALKQVARFVEADNAQANNNPSTGFSRRDFLKFSGAAGVGGFALGFAPLAEASLPAVAQAAGAGLKPTQIPQGFISIAADGRVTITVNRLDMGQGIETGLPLIAAEELDADWSKVQSAFGTADARYVDPVVGMHLTGGSQSIANSYTQYRELGARVRAMLVAAAAQQWKVKPEQCSTSKGVVSGPGNRRATYGSLAAAAMKQPVPAKVTLKDPKNFKLIGQPATLLAARNKSRGAQQYTIDVKRSGMLVAVIAQPPTFATKLKGFDAGAASKMRGVKAIFPVPLDMGAQGVAVVADSFWNAKQARDAMKVNWDLASVAKVDSAKQMAEYRELAAKPGKLSKYRDDTSKIAGAPNKIDAEFWFPYLAHAAMEPMSCVVDLTADKCEVWSASQMPGVDAGAIAKMTGLKPEQVRINVQMSGGGFGRRAVPTVEYHTEAVAVAMGLLKSGTPAPVKVMWTREDDMAAGYYRPSHLHKASIGFDAQGNILGWDHIIVGQSIVAGSPFEGFLMKEGIDGTITEGMRDPYIVPMKLSVHHPRQNVPVLWWRAVGSTHTAYVMETLLDEIAMATRQDPVAYRRKLLDAKKGARCNAALDLAVQKSGYGTRQLPAGRAWGVAVHESFNTAVAFIVEASVSNGVPRLHKVWAGVHCNLAINPRSIEAQIQGAALMGLGTCMPGEQITLKDGVVEQGNYGAYAVPRITDMPEVDVAIVPSADPPTGIGEPGLPPLAPAFANAIARLTGKRLRNMPFPEKIA